MAAQPPPAAQQVLEQAMQRNELAKLPIWFGEPSKDAFRADDWWSRFEAAALAAQWNWVQVQTYFQQAMRGLALVWWTSRLRTPVDIDDLRAFFLDDYGLTTAARTSVAQLRVIQGPHQLVRDYHALVRVAMDTLCLAIPAREAMLPADILNQRPAEVNIPAAADNWVQVQYIRLEALGYNRFYNTVYRNLFIDGLLPHLRDEVIRVNPLTIEDAYNLAKRVEKNANLKKNLSSIGATDLNPLEMDPISQRRGSRPSR
jgi:hypothetical protein